MNGECKGEMSSPDASTQNHGYVRRPVNAHLEFYGFWADGNPDTMSKSRLFFTDKSGLQVWCLPFDMDAPLAVPTAIYPRK